MPAIDKGFLQLLHEDYTKYNIFIETGTYMGDTTFSVEPLFDKLYTIEINNDLHRNAKSAYKGNKITFIQGDSSIVFTSLLPSIKDKAIFFLDGHWSAGITGRGAKDCPLYEEMFYINNLFEPEGIIIVDDVRLFGKGPKTNTDICDWSDIDKERLLDIVRNRIKLVHYLPSEKDKEDRLVIYIDSIT
jgi:predicted O-methyltransferase YrrM